MIVVRLDDSRFGAGPATIIEVIDSLEPISAVRDRYRDRDGAIPAALRVWRGIGAIGDRVKIDG